MTGGLGPPAGAQLSAARSRASWVQTLQHTYFQPATNQEQAAERLDLPFSTYRRHLRAASQYVCEWLWARYSQG
jgi:hypothetical protein